MNTNAIINYMLSKDPIKIWESSCTIISMSQDRDKTAPLTNYLDQIKDTTKNIKLGGKFSLNSEFLDYAIAILEFHKYNSSCTCLLYSNKYDRNNPNKEYEKGNIKIINSNSFPDWTDCRIVECIKCKQKFEVIGNYGGHYPFWKWELSN